MNHRLRYKVLSDEDVHFFVRAIGAENVAQTVVKKEKKKKKKNEEETYTPDDNNDDGVVYSQVIVFKKNCEVEFYENGQLKEKSFYLLNG